MPFSLPWFDNKPDPLLPHEQNIKPFLYCWDDYQTYDLFWFAPGDRRFYTPFYVSTQSCFPVPPVPAFMWQGYNEQDLYYPGYGVKASQPSNLVLFDRFTPWDYDWAEAYSTKFFDFIKKHTVRFYHMPHESSKGKLGFDSDRIIINFKYLPSAKIISDKKITFSFDAKKTETIILTWLEFDRVIVLDTGLDQYDPGYGYCETVKRCQFFKIQKGKNTLTLTFRQNFCACSIVVTAIENKNAIEQAIEKISLGILYKNLDNLFAEIDQYFVYEEIEVLIGEQIVYNINVPETKTYAPLPDWYYYAALIYANNNHWKNTVNIDLSKDLGKPIFCTYLYAPSKDKIIDLIFNIWGHASYVLMTGSKGTVITGINDLPNEPPGIIWELRQNNLFKHAYRVEGRTNEAFRRYFEWFDGGEEMDALIEQYYISTGRAVAKKDAITFLDARKKLELQENA